jgi:hypothetical protein
MKAVSLAGLPCMKIVLPVEQRLLKKPLTPVKSSIKTDLPQVEEAFLKLLPAILKLKKTSPTRTRSADNIIITSPNYTHIKIKTEKIG